jgi:methylenetetrahydrofolate reductase (NADPH)
MHHYGVDAVPHLICGGFSREDTENALIDLNFLNINNVLALRGDAGSFDAQFVPEPNGHHFALDLVSQIQNMNNGVYLDENINNGSKTDFCVGVAGYPEKHFEAPNLETDLHYLKKKVDAGADYIVTQMFFNNAAFFSFVDACRKSGINVPIIPGLKPVTRLAQLTSIPRSFNVNFPSELTKELQKATDDAQIKEVGIEWCTAQSKELLKNNVPCLHFYTMGDATTTRRIIEKIL